MLWLAIRELGSSRTAKASALLCFPILSALAQAVGGQSKISELTSASVRAQCTDARQVIAAHSLDDTATLSSIRRLGECDETAGVVLPNLWNSLQPVENRPAVLGALVTASSVVRDGRIAAPLLAIAADSARPALLRQAAIVVLATYIDPTISGQVVKATYHGEVWHVSARPTDHALQRDGRIEVDPALRRSLSEIVQQLALDRRHPGLRDVANVVKTILKI